MTEKEKCNHNAEHKEVLGHVLCVCCTHCQTELSKAKKEIERLTAENKHLYGASMSPEGKNQFQWVINENETLKKEAEELKQLVSSLGSALFDTNQYNDAELRHSFRSFQKFKESQGSKEKQG